MFCSPTLFIMCPQFLKSNFRLFFSLLFFFRHKTNVSISLTVHCFFSMVTSWCLNISGQRLASVHRYISFPAFPPSTILVFHGLKFYNTYQDYLEGHLNWDRNTQLFCPVHNIIFDRLRKSGLDLMIVHN